MLFFTGKVFWTFFYFSRVYHLFLRQRTFEKDTFGEKSVDWSFFFNAVTSVDKHNRVLNIYSSNLNKTIFYCCTLENFDITVFSLSSTSHGRLVMEHDEPWKVFHDHAMIIERRLYYIDLGRAAMIFLYHGKPTMGSITGHFRKLIFQLTMDHILIVQMRIVDFINR